MNPWTLLGLDADADARSIKRRYAQLLKQHRPDEDAEAFQRLREAYEWVQSEVLSQRFQEQVFAIFERYNQADLLLLGRLKSLFRWREEEQHLPCNTERWQRLNERPESERVFTML